MKLKWTDVDAIAEILYDRFSDLDPLSIRFTDLHKWIMEIEQFDDSPERAGERVLEAVQMAWYEEWKLDQ